MTSLTIAAYSDGRYEGNKGLSVATSNVVRKSGEYAGVMLWLSCLRASPAARKHHAPEHQCVGAMRWNQKAVLDIKSCRRIIRRDNMPCPLRYARSIGLALGSRFRVTEVSTALGELPMRRCTAHVGMQVGPSTNGENGSDGPTSLHWSTTDYFG